MQKLRAALRLVTIVFITLLTVTLFCLGIPFCTGSKERRIKLKNAVISRWARAVATVINLKIQIKGQPPDPPFLLVSNHLSYIDILPFWALLKTTFIAKLEIRGWPLIGWIAGMLGIIFIDRENTRDISRVNRIIEQHRGEKQGIILFPEGTSSGGKRVLPFKSSLLHYPASVHIPVHYASVSYHLSEGQDHNPRTEICWWGNMDFISHFWNLLHIKSFIVTVHFGDEPVRNKNRKQLTQQLHQKVKDDFIPTAGRPPRH